MSHPSHMMSHASHMMSHASHMVSHASHMVSCHMTCLHSGPTGYDHLSCSVLPQESACLLHGVEVHPHHLTAPCHAPQQPQVTPTQGHVCHSQPLQQATVNSKVVLEQHTQQ